MLANAINPLSVEVRMNNAICAMGLCLLLAVAGCSLSGSASSSEPAAPAPAAGGSATVSLALAPAVDAATSTITGEFRLDPAQVALPAELEVSDASGASIARAETSTDKPIAIVLPKDATGLLAVTAMVTAPGGATVCTSAYVLAGPAAGLERLVALVEAALTLRMAAADAKERRELERQSAVIRFARVWLATPPSEVKDRLPELEYLCRMLPEQAAGHDYMMEVHGSHLALVDHPDLTWGGVTTTRFWVHLPTDYESRTDWPVVFFLHGATQATNMIEPFRSPTAAFPGGVGMPCVGITPKSEIQGGWQPEVLNQLLDYVLAHYNVDADRVSVVGHSRGAAGTLAWAMTSPERIAAIAPTAGGASLLDAYKIAHIPAWFVHGTADRAGSSVRMTEWLRRYGAEPRLTLIPGGVHMDTFQELAKPEFWTWMASHRRAQPPTDLKAPAFGQDGLTTIEQDDLPAQRLLYAGAPAGGDAPPAQFDTALEARLYDAALAAGLQCGVPMAVVRPRTDGSEVLSGILVRGVAAASEGWQMAELPAGRCARALYKGSAESLADTCVRLRDRLRAEGARPTGELRCLYWGSRPGPQTGGRGRAGGSARGRSSTRRRAGGRPRAGVRGRAEHVGAGVRLGAMIGCAPLAAHLRQGAPRRPKTVYLPGMTSSIPGCSFLSSLTTDWFASRMSRHFALVP